MRHTWVGFMVVVALASSASADAPAPDEPLYACRPLPPGAKITASFKPNTSVADLAIWLQGFTCKNVVFGSDVASTAVGVNIITSRQMTSKQAVQLFVDAVEATGLKVTQKADTVIIKLGPGMKPGCVTMAATTPTMPTPPVEDPMEVTDAAEVEAEAAKGIKVVSATEVHVTRATLDVFLKNPKAFEKGARLVPAVKDGKPAGFKLYAIRPSTAVARIGLQNGDSLIAINGVPADTAVVLEAYTKFRVTKKLELSLVRRGAPMTITLLLKDKL